MIIKDGNIVFMSYPINQKIVPYQQNQPSMGPNAPTYSQQQPAMGINTPQMQDVNTDTVAQGITQNSVLKGVSNGDKESNPIVTLLLTIPIAIGLIKGMGKFNNACSDSKYENTILGKAAKLGDDISAKLTFIDPAFEKFEKGLKYIDEKIISQSSVLSALFHAPSKPENKMVLTMAGGSKTDLAKDAISKLQEHFEKGEILHHEGVDYKRVPGELAQNASASDIAAKAASDKMDKMLKDLSENSHDKIDEIIKLCKAQGAATTEARNVLNLKNIPLLGRLFKSLPEDKKYLSDYATPLKKLGRDISFSEYVSKIETFTASKASSKLGSFLPHAMIRCLEGLTNGTAGGKFAIALGAFFIADAIKKGIDAPKGETVKTTAENLTYNTGWYLTMPLGLSLMHHAGGLQYIGMGKGLDAAGKNVIEGRLQEYRKQLKVFNENAEKGNFASKDEYNKAEAELNKILKGVDAYGAGINGRAQLNNPKTWHRVLYKPIRGLASMFTVGLETRRPYIATETIKSDAFMSKTIKFAKNIPFKLKNGAGYPVRFIAFMFVVAPPLAKIGAKLSHMIFGKPTKSVLDEGEESEEKQQNQYQPLVMPQQDQSQIASQTPSQASGQPASVMQPTNNQNNQNLIGNDNAQQSQKAVVANQQPVRRYIPSSSPVRINPNQAKDPKDAKVEAAFNKANYAEKGANKYIPEQKQK